MVKLSASQIAGVVKYHGASTGSSFATSLFKPDTDGPIFVAIALAESGGETTAENTANRNGSTDYGLWQINSVHKELLESYKPWTDPKQNYAMAARLYQGRDGKFTDWSVFNNGRYAPFLPEATTAWSNPDMSNAGTNPVSDAANTTYAAATGIGDLVAALTKSSTWVRIGMGLAGLLLVLVAVVALTKSRLPIPGPLGAAVRAAGKKAA